jgi:hypothetical protein
MVIEILKFFKFNLWNILLLPVLGLTLITALHEAAHCVGALVQGGTILEFKWLPTNGHFGYMRYEYGNNPNFSPFWVSVSPYVMWSTIALIGFALSEFISVKPRLGSIIFIWLIFIPVGDIGLAILPYQVFHAKNDIHSAFSDPTFYSLIIIVILVIIVCYLGYRAQRKLYQSYSLSIKSYIALFTFSMIAITLI